MQVIHAHGDYMLQFSRGELEALSTPYKGTLPYRYPFVEEQVEDPKHTIDELCYFRCSNDSEVFNCSGHLSFDRDEEGIVVNLHTREALRLVRGEADSLMTRYDGANKLYVEIIP